MRLSADRMTAARMLMRVEEGAFSSRLLSGGGAPAARVRVLEVLRSMRAIDAVLQPRCRRKLRKLDPEVRAAMRIGLADRRWRWRDVLAERLFERRVAIL